MPVCLACAWTPVLHTEGCTQAWPLGAHSHWCHIRVHEYSMPRGACPPGECSNGPTCQPDTSCLTSDAGVRSHLERNKRALGHAGRAERRVSAAFPTAMLSIRSRPLRNGNVRLFRNGGPTPEAGVTSPTNFAKREGAREQKHVECTFISLAADPETDADLAQRAEDAGGRWWWWGYDANSFGFVGAGRTV